MARVHALLLALVLCALPFVAEAGPYICDDGLQRTSPHGYRYFDRLDHFSEVPFATEDLSDDLTDDSSKKLHLDGTDEGCFPVTFGAHPQGGFPFMGEYHHVGAVCLDGFITFGERSVGPLAQEGEKCPITDNGPENALFVWQEDYNTDGASDGVYFEYFSAGSCPVDPGSGVPTTQGCHTVYWHQVDPNNQDLYAVLYDSGDIYTSVARSATLGPDGAVGLMNAAQTEVIQVLCDGDEVLGSNTGGGLYAALYVSDLASSVCAGSVTPPPLTPVGYHCLEHRDLPNTPTPNYGYRYLDSVQYGGPEIGITDLVANEPDSSRLCPPQAQTDCFSITLDTSFTFMGETFSTAFACVDGFLTFGDTKSADANAEAHTCPIESNAQDYAINILRDNLGFEGTGVGLGDDDILWYQYFPECPGTSAHPYLGTMACHIIEWRDIEHGPIIGGLADNIEWDMEIILYENGDIGTVVESIEWEAGAFASVGLLDPNGPDDLEVSCNKTFMDQQATYSGLYVHDYSCLVVGISVSNNEYSGPTGTLSVMLENPPQYTLTASDLNLSSFTGSSVSVTSVSATGTPNVVNVHYSGLTHQDVAGSPDLTLTANAPTSRILDSFSLNAMFSLVPGWGELLNGNGVQFSLDPRFVFIFRFDTTVDMDTSQINVTNGRLSTVRGVGSSTRTARAVSASAFEVEVVAVCDGAVTVTLPQGAGVPFTAEVSASAFYVGCLATRLGRSECQ